MTGGITDPAGVLDAIHDDASALDAIGKDISTATEELLLAEAAWEERFDEVADALKGEMILDGRKGDPAEHTIISATRRLHRDVWMRYRTAKRRLEAHDRQLRAKTAALSGRQSELRGLTDEVRAQDYVSQRRAA